VGLEGVPPSLVRIIEELLERKNSDFGLENRDPLRLSRDTRYPQKWADIFRLRAQSHGDCLLSVTNYNVTTNRQTYITNIRGRNADKGPAGSQKHPCADKYMLPCTVSEAKSFALL
jgi:hypothetical protein